MKPWAKAALQGAACGLMLGAVVLIGWRLWWPQVVGAQAKQPAVADVVRAKRFEVVDAAGKVRAIMGAEKGNPGVSFFDEGGYSRAALVVTPDGSVSLVLLDGTRKPRAAMGLRSDGSTALELSDTGGQRRIGLNVDRDGSPALRFQDAAGKLRVHMRLYPNGSPQVNLYDAAESVRAVLAVAEGDNPALVLFDSADKMRIWAGLVMDSPSLSLHDAAGKTVWQTP